MTTWILLRGLAREARHWGGVPDLLAARLPPGHRVACLDLPGAGELHRQASPASVEALASATAALAASRGLPAPLVLVGLSLGGMVALEWARQHPGDVAACALINSSIGGHSPFWQRLRPAQYGRIARLLLPGTPALTREQGVLALTSQRHAGDLTLAQRWAGWAQERPMRAASVLRQLYAAARYRPLGPPLRARLLILGAAGDRLVSPACAVSLSRAWHVPLRQHPWAGHDLALDDAAWLIGRLCEWAATGYGAGDLAASAQRQGCTSASGTTTTGENPPPSVRKLVVWPA